MKKKTNLRPPSKRKHPPVVEKPEEPSNGHLPIVAIGASAGGLEALEQLLGNTSADSGMAFVIIQHLDPTHKGIMPQLLQRTTVMKVVQVTDRTRVQADHVYVIPPNKDMSILHGVLHLLDPIAPRGLRLPIDFFFRSMAQDQGEHSIGVILSGMGSDGTLGMRAIKEKAGLILVQDPATAKFDSMPRSAIETGLADIVAAAAEIPDKILVWLKHRSLVGSTDQTLQEKAKSALEKTVLLLRAHTGHDFSHYKHKTLYRRIERRMGIHQISRIDGYIRYLQENSQELDFLFKELLIGVTNFFRDEEAWNELRDVAIPAMLAARPSGQTALRVWVPGCSSGEEAYSLAMVLREAVDACKLKGSLTIQVFATDLDRDAIDKARGGFFTDNIVADVSPERLDRFFNKEEQGYRVRSEIRDTVIFAAQNLIMDPPFTRLDILSCRNLMIYLEPEVQKKLIPLFHYSLNPGGVLFLGSAETVGEFNHLFTSLQCKASLYQRKESTLGPGPLEFPTSFSAQMSSKLDAPQDQKREQGLQILADKLVLQRYAPRPPWLMIRVTSCISAGAPVNIWNRRLGRSTGTFSPWSAKGCAMSSTAPFRKRFAKTGKSPVGYLGRRRAARIRPSR